MTACPSGQGSLRPPNDGAQRTREAGCEAAGCTRCAAAHCWALAVVENSGAAIDGRILPQLGGPLFS